MRHSMTSELTEKSQIDSKVDTVKQITKIVQSIRFGSVEIVIHDGKIVQVERKEKLRFDTKNN
ncbi:MAG: putative small protein [Pseudomonadota bacterium]|jgi:hypothetical protein